MLNMQFRIRPLALVFVLLSMPLFGAAKSGRYALILQDEPAIKSMKRGGRRNAPEVLSARQNIRTKQAVLRKQLEAKGFRFAGATDTLLNAIFVVADRSDVPTLKAMPGVRAVFPITRQHLDLNAAVALLDAPNAWTALGGISNAGAGVKIGILDTGIDQTHPAFQDSTLQFPAGFPKSDNPADLAFTNTKVIVARSYVSYDVNGQGSSSQYTTPDDESPRDRVGHGTAVAMCAGGNTNTGPLATITGLAPKAFLGNYKIYGSPGINDGAYTSAIIAAIEDAFNDDMDVINISSGGPAFSEPLEQDSFCETTFGSAQCDPEAIAVETAIQGGMVVVTAAGNEGQNGAYNGAPTYNTVGSPAYTPDAIAVGAVGNSHQVSESVQIAGPGSPSAISNLAATGTNTGQSGNIFSAPIVDAAKVGDQYGCSSYPDGTLSGSIALIERGPANDPCDFSLKASNAQSAGAVGVLFYNDDSPENDLIYTDSFSIPAFFIGATDGQAVKAYLDTTSGVTATFNGNFTFTPSTDTDQVTYFSSRGPALGLGLKPDVAAVGENVYMATQSYDPQGELYDPSGYTAADGTSFSSPMVAGIAALVIQNNPGFTTATQVKSAIVNTATSDTSDPYTGDNPSGVLSVGGGKAEALHSIQSNVTVEPSTISFGSLTGSVNNPQTLTITNFTGSAVTLSLGITRTVADAATQLTVSPSQLVLAPAAAGTVTVTLTGSKPAPGIYEGALTVTGGAQALHVPYLYIVGDGVPYELISLAGDQETGAVGQVVPDGFSAFQVQDQYGVPIAGLPVSWSAPDGSGSSVTNFDTVTNQFGQAYATTTLGTTPGIYDFYADIAGFDTYDFQVQAIPLPVITTGGVVNAASQTALNGIAPGSYITIYGTGLATVTDFASYVPFPIALDLTSVGFDATNVSVPAPISYISATQINVQVPWELAGQSSADLKVDIEPIVGQVITVPVTTYSPALFLYNGIPASINVSNGSAVTPTNPATRGQYVSLYCNGLGPVTNQPATGAAALANPLSNTIVNPVVTIGGVNATYNFSGLTPTAVGLYQINVLVPTTIAAGNQPVALSINGVAAPVVNLPVQ